MLAALGQRLVAMGFREGGVAGVHVRPLGEETESWVGLTTAARPGVDVVVAPNVGVRHGEVEAEVARLSGGDPSGLLPPTVAAPLAEWSPRHGRVKFESADGFASRRRLNAVAAAIDGAARALAVRAATPEALAEALGDARLTLPGEGPMRRAVLLRRLGREAEAAAVVDEAVAALGQRTDPAAERARRFAEAFRTLPRR